MMVSDATADEFQQLIQAMLDGSASDADLRKLETLLDEDEERARIYVNLVRQEVMLRNLFDGNDRCPVSQIFRKTGSSSEGTCSYAHSSSQVIRTSPHKWVAGIATIVAVFLGMFVVHGWQRQGNEPIHQLSAVAKLTRAIDCTWRDGSFPIGTTWESGMMRLVSGLAELTLSSGVSLILEGPAEFELINPMRCALYQGNVFVKVPDGISGFVLSTPGTRLIDHGTEFGVNVDDDNRTILQVYQGEVIANTSSDTQRRVLANQAVVLFPNGTTRGEELAFDERRFVHYFPQGPQEFRYLPPYNEAQLTEMHIPYTKHPPVIDGRLEDWDRSGMFVSRCNPPYDQDYFVEGGMMYDDQYLYIAAHVADPFPMRNQFSSDVTPDLAWKGGGLRVRLTTDPKLGYPLPDRDSLTAQKREEEKQYDSYVHLLMWYFRPEERARLLIDHGLGSATTQFVPAEGWQGTFRQDANGRGYTLEYAIPWSLIAPNRPVPKPEQPYAVSWQLHWSDAEGQVWQGHLLECVHMGTIGSRRLHGHPEFWGRAIYGSPPVVQ